MASNSNSRQTAISVPGGDFARIVQSALYSGLRRVNKNVRNLGVKQAPFMVLVGATMPAILAEISFMTNRQDAALLKKRTRAPKTKNRRQLASDVGHLGFGIVAPGLSLGKVRGWFDPTQTRGRGAWGLRAGAGPNRLRQRR